MIEETNKIIDSLGGTTALAKLLNVNLSAVSNYRKKGFPDRLHYKIATLCNERDIKIDGKIFGELSKNLPAVDTRPLEILSDISIKVIREWQPTSTICAATIARFCWICLWGFSRSARIARSSCGTRRWRNSPKLARRTSLALSSAICPRPGRLCSKSSLARILTTLIKRASSWRTTSAR